MATSGEFESSLGDFLPLYLTALERVLKENLDWTHEQLFQFCYEVWLPPWPR